MHTITWNKNMHMSAHTQSGHEITLDGPPDLGGENLGARPMEMLLVGLGGCTTVDVVSTLQKMREALSTCKVEITSERASEHPKVFTKIHLNFVLTGTNLSHAKVEKAIHLSAEKYCSASIMLGAMATITHSFEVSEC